LEASAEVNDQNENAPLEFERLRVEIERRRLMLDERRAELEALLVGAEDSREFANQYAKAALQSLFLLNGGALIAFPAFGQLVGTAFNEQLGVVILSLAGFVGGLACVILATLLAFLALDADAQCIYYMTEDRQRQYAKVQYPDTYDEAIEAARVESEMMSGKCQAQFVLRRRWAILLGLLSLAAFIFGALCAAGVLAGPSTLQPTTPPPIVYPPTS
jgi:hypothetical protein